MATITVKDEDVRAADAFLTAYLKDKVPDADFNAGSALRDLVVKAMAYVFAYLEGERRTIRTGQSLRALAAAEPSEDVDSAILGHLSNWFLAPRDGEVARVMATLHFTAAGTYRIPNLTRFTYPGGLVFIPDLGDAVTALEINGLDLRPVLAFDGTVTDYTVTIPLIATEPGAQYNVPPGEFERVDRFETTTNYFGYAEVTSSGVGGKASETAQELLARANTAISVRNLVNSRSIDAVLKSEFPSLRQVLTVGYGDPEMLRDFVGELVSYVRYHAGGAVDVYVSLPRTVPQGEAHVLGGLEIRPDGRIVEFNDTAADFFTAGVKRGDILCITGGMPSAQLNDPSTYGRREYIISDVLSATRLRVQANYPFPVATDEKNIYVTYTVGDDATTTPPFSNKVSSASGQSSRKMAVANGVMLQGRPHYRIIEVALRTSANQTIIIPHRVNFDPVSDSQYRVVELQPGTAQSSVGATLITFAPSLVAAYPGAVVKVTYESLQSFDLVQAYVNDPYRRTVTTDTLVRGYHPVYIRADIKYQLRKGASVDPGADAVKSTLVEYINNFDPNQVIDVSGAVQALRDAYPDIGIIFGPVELYYDLLAPDGQVYRYVTSDVVTVFPKHPDNTAKLVNSWDPNGLYELANPIPDATSLDPVTREAANTELRARLAAIGVSDRVVCYYADADLITVTRV